jgi:hypothetical protein
VREPDDEKDDPGVGEISLVRGDPLFRAQRALGLLPRHGLAVGRRALLFALFTWLPIAIWAWLAGRAFPGAPVEVLTQHFGVTARCLIAIPLLVLAEGFLHERTSRLIPFFLRSGLVPETERARFGQVVQGIARLRDGTLPWIAIAALIAAWTLSAPEGLEAHEVVWATEETRPGFGFGGL